MSTSVATSTAELEARRSRLLADLGSVGDLRPGTLVERFRKCGKPNCRCAREGDPGHGPVWTLTFRSGGKSKNQMIPPEAVAETRAQVEECRRLRRLTGELIEVSEGLCHARLSSDREAGREAKKGASRKPSRRSAPPRPGG